MEFFTKSIIQICRIPVFFRLSKTILFIFIKGKSAIQVIRKKSYKIVAHTIL